MKILVNLFIVLLIPVQMVYANQVSDLPLDEKIEQSELIFVGEVELIHDSTVPKYALINIVEKVKGDPETDEIKFDHDIQISELKPGCCEVGKQYLFFVRQSNNELFFSFNGRFGVYPIKNDIVTNWPCASTNGGTSLDSVVSTITDLMD